MTLTRGQHQLEQTADGSPTLRHAKLGVTYHSTHGALTETEHVFIEFGLKFWVDKAPTDQSVHVVEMGMGTGLNILAANAVAIQQKINLHISTFEQFPLNQAEIELVIGQLPIAFVPFAKQLHQAGWGVDFALSDHTQVTKIKADLVNYPIKTPFDVCFYDAFAPNVQPELWTLELFTKLRHWANPNAVLTTYCAKGEVRRNLMAAGWQVEKCPGPPGKREMLRAVAT